MDSRSLGWAGYLRATLCPAPGHLCLVRRRRSRGGQTLDERRSCSLGHTGSTGRPSLAFLRESWCRPCLPPSVCWQPLSLRGAWNPLLWPQVLITEKERMLLMPAIVRLNNLTVPDAYARHVDIAAAILALGLYAYSQRYFVATLAGAVKG